MTRSSFDWAKLENLAERIYGGQVVFFVGAGFSLDSEGISSWRLLLRLLARFDGFSWVLARSEGEPGSALARAAAQALELRRSLRETFGLESREQLELETTHPSADDRLTTGNDAWILASDYYRPNEWFCTAFGTLLAACDELPSFDWEQVHARERELLAKIQVGGKAEVLPPIEAELLAGQGKAVRGKALFIDTLGFADREVMAGRPHAPSLTEVMRSYADPGHHLRARHHVLARWAREGLCMTLLTTNYDLLLEGAYRLAGFASRRSDVEGRAPDDPPLYTEVSHFDRIGDALGFVRFGNAHRSALIAKIHGCAEIYSTQRRRVVEALVRVHELERSGTDEQRALARSGLEKARLGFVSYLPAIVFTFREIQNWRHDAWSRDLLANLLRTRSIVFCGYSAQDRVLHDAFRTVYEEIAAVRHSRGDAEEQAITAGAGRAADAAGAYMGRDRAAPGSHQARAFFLGVAGKLEFDALEVLRSASRAEGIVDPAQTEHNNYVQFHIERGGHPVGFPGLDQTMRWLWHRTSRIRHREVVDAELRRVATTLLGHTCPEREREMVAERLARLTAVENAAAKRWSLEPPEPLAFERIVGWTDRFHPALLREFALGETVLRRHGPGFSLQAVHRRPWYFPASERAEWTAWGVVVELALRRMIAWWRCGERADEPEGEVGSLAWMQPTPLLSLGRARRPLLGFSDGPLQQPRPPHGLRIALLDFAPSRRTSSVRGAYVGLVHSWSVRPHAIPWWGPEQPPPVGTPSAARLWAWAAGGAPSEAMLRDLPAELIGPRQLGRTGARRVA